MKGLVSLAAMALLVGSWGGDQSPGTQQQSNGTDAPTPAASSSTFASRQPNETDTTRPGAEWGFDYGEQSRLDFISACTADGIVPASYCECFYQRIAAEVAFDDFYDLLQQSDPQSGLFPEELMTLGRGCVQPGDPNPAIISDAVFVEAANAICAATLRRLEQDTDPSPSENVRIAARGFRRMVAELRELPVADESVSAVNLWLTLWDEVLAGVERYADDIEAAGDEFIEIGKDARRLDELVKTIADQNGMPDCVI